MRERRGLDRDYKRGAIMGLTVAEAFILLAFCLLLLFSWWQAETERDSLVAAEQIGKLTDQQKAEVIDGLSDGTFEMANTMRKEGLAMAGPGAIEDAKAFSRFMSQDDLRRLMKGAAELPPDTRLRLADTVEIGDAAHLVQAMSHGAPADPNDPIAQIAQRIEVAAEAERSLVATLQDRLGATIHAAGGEISADGTISLPQSVLFEINDDRIKNAAFLRSFCAPWLQTMRDSGVDISELKIEGHASSEGPPGATPEAAYLYNLGLSQRRAQNALTVCLNGLEAPPVQEWAREHLAAVGYSSTRLIRTPSGAEDRDASRRVMFSVAVDREQLLDDIQRDLAPDARKSAPTSARPAHRPDDPPQGAAQN